MYAGAAPGLICCWQYPLVPKQPDLILQLRQKPATLSGGQLQRAAIARALINRPKILLADEPTGNLDRTNTERILDLLLQIKREQHTALIVVTHDEQVAARADRVLHMFDGRLTVC